MPSPGSGVLQEILVAGGRDGRRRDARSRGSAPADAAAAAPAPAAPEPLPSPTPSPSPRPPSPSRPSRWRPSPPPAPAPPAPRRQRLRGGERHDLRLAGRRADRRRARHRPRRPSPAPAATAASRRRTSWPSSRRRLDEGQRLRQPAPAAPPAAPPPPPPPPAAPPPAATAAPPAEPQAPGAGETLEPMTAMRRGIAEHMRRSLDTAAHVTSAIEVDMSKVVAIRETAEGRVQGRRYGVNLTYLAFVARATVETLRDWPYVNAEIRGESIVTQQLRQPRLRRRARRRQGTDRPGAQARRGPQPARHGPRRRRSRRARADEEAAPRRRPGRHVHDHEPRQLRHVHRHAGDQPAAERASSAPTPSSSGRG